MIRVFIAHNGAILNVIGGTFEQIELNTPVGSAFIDVDIKPDSSAYWDAVSEQFVSIGDPPSHVCIFDYDVKQWIDPRTLDEYKADKWRALKQQRDALEYAPVIFEGNYFDADQVSQIRIAGAALAQQPQTWTTADNVKIDLSALQLSQLYAKVQTNVAAAHTRGRAARDLLDAATSKEEIDAIKL